MFIAQELRKKSTAEFVLYMWQVEDIIRAYGCQLSRIKNEYISRFANYTDEQREEMVDWYGDLITMMNSEGKREKGHLTINQIVVQDMNELHNQLLQSSRFPFYNSEYYRVLPFIVELRNRGDKDCNEIETCLNALYGTMMLRLQNKTISPDSGRTLIFSSSSSSSSKSNGSRPSRSILFTKIITGVLRIRHTSISLRDDIELIDGVYPEFDVVYIVYALKLYAYVDRPRQRTHANL